MSIRKDPPPPPWLAIESEEYDGMMYYFNEETGETQWEHPLSSCKSSGLPSSKDSPKQYYDSTRQKSQSLGARGPSRSCGELQQSSSSGARGPSDLTKSGVDHTDFLIEVKLRYRGKNEYRRDELLDGAYRRTKGFNHGKPVYCKEDRSGKPVKIYFWDGRDHAEFAGWWFGAEVGGESVWAHHESKSAVPPNKGWMIVDEPHLDLEVKLSSPVAKASSSSSWPTEKRPVAKASSSSAQPAEKRPKPSEATVNTKTREARSIPQLNESDKQAVDPKEIWIPPKPWTAIPHMGGHYYWNPETSESTWYPPKGSVKKDGNEKHASHDREQVSKDREQKRSAAIGTTDWKQASNDRLRTRTSIAGDASSRSLTGRDRSRSRSREVFSHREAQQKNGSGRNPLAEKQKDLPPPPGNWQSPGPPPGDWHNSKPASSLSPPPGNWPLRPPVAPVDQYARRPPAPKPYYSHPPHPGHGYSTSNLGPPEGKASWPMRPPMTDRSIPGHAPSTFSGQSAVVYPPPAGPYKGSKGGYPHTPGGTTPQGNYSHTPGADLSTTRESHVNEGWRWNTETSSAHSGSGVIPSKNKQEAVPKKKAASPEAVPKEKAASPIGTPASQSRSFTGVSKLHRPSSGTKQPPQGRAVNSQKTAKSASVPSAYAASSGPPQPKAGPLKPGPQTKAGPLKPGLQWGQSKPGPQTPSRQFTHPEKALVEKRGEMNLHGKNLGDHGLEKYLQDEGASHLERVHESYPVRSGCIQSMDFSDNNLTDDGMEAIVRFVIDQGRPVKAMKLRGNNFSEPVLSRLLEDDTCGLGTDEGLSKVDLSNNRITQTGLMNILESLLTFRITSGKPLKPAFWLWLDGNGLDAEDQDEMIEMMREQGLRIHVRHRDKQIKQGEENADVHIFFGTSNQL